jgi:hypothetical protein
MKVGSGVPRFSRRDWWTALALCAGAAVLYAATRTKLPYLWDSVEFALAIRNFNVALSQPHPPGYFLYVMLGRLVNAFIGDPHASLVWLSIGSGATLVAMVYLTGAAMFGRPAGLAAGLVTLSSPMIWFYSSVALTYVTDALLVCTLVLVCWRARARDVPWGFVVGIGALLAVIGGIRQQSVPGLSVVVVVTLWSHRPLRWQKLTVALAVWAALTAAWVVPMLRMTGGWEAYRDALTQISRFHAHKTLWGGGLEAVTWNLFFAGLYCFDGLLLGVLFLPRARGGGFVWLWVVPVFLLATLAGYTEAPGHVMTYLPGLLLLVGAAVAQLRRRAAVLVSIVAVNVFAFVGWPHAWDRFAWGTMRTARELATHDQRLREAGAAIRSNCRPGGTVVCHLHGDLLFGLRLFQWVTPEFEHVRLDPDLAMSRPKSLMSVCGERTKFIPAVDWRGKDVALLVVPPGQTLSMFEKYFDLSNAVEVTGSDGLVFRVPAPHP